MTQYAARYRAARAYADLSQEKLAEQLGVDAQTIKRREAGKQEPKKAELIAVAAICQVPLEFMENGWGNLTADEITMLLQTQNGILARIEDSIRREEQAKKETEEATKRLLAAAELAGRALRPSTQNQEAVPDTQAT